MLYRSFLFGLLLLLPVAVGCNGGNSDLIPVAGKVTFDGNTPPAPGVVQFTPVELAEGHPKRTATGQFSTDGIFHATSFKPGDGLFPGKYFATVICNKPKLDYSKKDPFRDASYIADGYEGKEVVVEEGADEMTFEFDVPLKKG
jgi:hypothetical protein